MFINEHKPNFNINLENLLHTLKNQTTRGTVHNWIQTQPNQLHPTFYIIAATHITLTITAALTLDRVSAALILISGAIYLTLDWFKYHNHSTREHYVKGLNLITNEIKTLEKHIQKLEQKHVPATHLKFVKTQLNQTKHRHIQWALQNENPYTRGDDNASSWSASYLLIVIANLQTIVNYLDQVHEKYGLQAFDPDWELLFPQDITNFYYDMEQQTLKGFPPPPNAYWDVETTHKENQPQQ